VTDGWLNLASGQGTAADCRTQATIARWFPTYQQLDEMYRGNDLAATIVDDFVDEMFRKGFEIRIENDTDLRRR
jgi:hypothetical protein